MKKDFIIVAKGVIIKDSKVLLLHRSKKEIESSIINKWNAWDLPGGGVQFFENTEKALHREIKEETALYVNIKNIISFYDVIKYHLHAGIATYLCEYKGGKVTLSDEHDGYYWLTLNEVDNSQLPTWLKKYFYTALKSMNI